MTGTRLGRYEILDRLGGGGMGEVYEAEDTRLNRRVALKVLSPETADDPSRRERFEREARAVAALDHPNIVAVHSLEEATLDDGDETVRFITMQLVEGRTLDELIPPGGLPLGTFFEVAIPLADAMAAAHERGVVHRDLKPTNVMVTEDGRVRVLDFGLAKLKEDRGPAEGESAAATERLTGEGQIVGTVSYMSPEQAEGREVDERSDIFSLGVLLYRMATGRPPFEGDTPVSIISSIVKEEPESLASVKPATPRHLGRIVKLCLEKDPDDRLQTAKGLRNQLRELKEEIDSGELAVGEATSGERRVRESAAAPGRRWIGATLGAAALVLLTVGGIYFLPDVDEQDGTPPLAASATLERLTSHAGAEAFPNLTPDGDWLVYAATESGDWDIYLRSVGSAESINLTDGSPAQDTQPALSPDGRRIAFRSDRADGGIFVMDRMGASVRRLTDFGFYPSWSPDGEEIVVGTEDVPDPRARLRTSRLWAVDVETGERRRIAERDAVQPAWSPHGERIAYWGLRAATGHRDIWTITPEGSDRVAVTDDEHLDWSPAWSPDGRYLYFASDRSGSMSLWRVAVDRDTGEPLGELQPVTTGGAGEQYHLSVVSDGHRIAYVEGQDRIQINRVSFDPSTGSVDGEPVAVTRGTRSVFSLALSPDGGRLAFTSFGEREDLFVARSDGTEVRQLTDDAALDRGPRWSPDGERIAFYSNRSGSYELWTIRGDGSRLRQVTDHSELSLIFPVWSPDGDRIAGSVLTEPREAAGSYLIELDAPRGERQPDRLPPLGTDEQFVAFSWSPDGERIAGYRHVTGVGPRGIVVFSLESREYRKVADIGTFPTWLHDGRRLLFLHQEQERAYLADTASGRVREILSLSPDAIFTTMATSPDDTALFFPRRHVEADVWMLDLPGGP